MHKASCLCGRVTFEFDADPDAFGLCNCRSCQKASGSAFGANIPVARQAFRLLSGTAEIREYESSPGKRRCFCSNCGSPLFAKVGKNADTLRVRLGSLDTEFHHSPACHYFTSERPAWFQRVDEITRFDQWPDEKFLKLGGSKQIQTQETPT